MIRRARGFTLVEVLLATVLLAAGLALAFATLGAASRTAARGEAMAQYSERMRAVEGFLRTRLSGARPVSFGLDPDNNLPQRFIGEPERVRFVADLPDYLGRGGPYLHDFAVASDGDDTRMTLALAMVLAGQTVEERQPRPPEPLVEGLKSAHFRYAGRNDQGELVWNDRWEFVDRLPQMIEVTLSDRNGRAWPTLVVALPLATSPMSSMSGPQMITQ